MPKIAISTDSTCAISQEEAKKLGIFVLPLNVIVDNVEYHDGIDINPAILANAMRQGSIIKTSTPTPMEIDNFFNNIFALGYDEIIHLTISSKLTSIYNLFTIRCQENYNDKVTVIDSLSVCSYMGNIVRFAKKLVDSNISKEQILQQISSRICVEDIFFIPENLTYLKRGGRISPTAATIGNLLGIKPVLRFEKGAIEKFGTTRAFKMVLPQIVELFKKANYSPEAYEIHIVEFDCPLMTRLAKDFLSNEFSEYNIVVTDISINVCAHTGPGTIGIGFTLKP